MKQPLISIITVTFNAAGTLERAIRSVLNQTYGNYEYIIIDGASTDGTTDIIGRYSDRLTYWISEPDRGLYDAMNKGIAVAHGDYIYFLGSDDMLFPTALEEIFSGHTFDSGTVIYGNVRFSTGFVYGGEFSRWRLTTQNLSHQSAFYPAAVQKANLYELEYRYFADWVLNMKLWGGEVCRFLHVPTIVAEYDINGASSGGDPHFKKMKHKLICRHLGLWCYLFYPVVRLYMMYKYKRHSKRSKIKTA